MLNERRNADFFKKKMPSPPPAEWPLSRKVHFLFEERGIQRTKFDAVSTSIILKLLNRGIVPSRKMLTYIVQKLPPESLTEFVRLGEEQEKNLQ